MIFRLLLIILFFPLFSNSQERVHDSYKPSDYKIEFDKRINKLYFNIVDTIIYCYSSITNKEEFKLKGHSSKVKDVVYSNDGKHIYSIGGDEKFIIWDALTSEKIIIINNVSISREYIKDSKLGDILILSKRDTLTENLSTFLFDLNKMKPALEFNDFNNYQIQFLVAKRYLGLDFIKRESGKNINLIQIYDLLSKKIINEYSYIKFRELTYDSLKMICIPDECCESQTIICAIKENKKEIFEGDFLEKSENGSFIYTVTKYNDKSLNIIDSKNYTLIKKVEGTIFTVYDNYRTQSELNFYIENSFDSTVSIYNKKNAKYLATMKGTFLSYNNNGKYYENNLNYLPLTFRDSVYIFDLNGKILKTFKGNSASTNFIKSNNIIFIFSGSENEVVKIYRYSTKEILNKNTNIKLIANYKGEYIISSFDNHSFKLYKLKKFKLIKEFHYPNYWNARLSFSDSGKYIIESVDDNYENTDNTKEKSLRLWSLEENKFIKLCVYDSTVRAGVISFFSNDKVVFYQKVKINRNSSTKSSFHILNVATGKVLLHSIINDTSTAIKAWQTDRANMLAIRFKDSTYSFYSFISSQSLFKTSNSDTIVFFKIGAYCRRILVLYKSNYLRLWDIEFNKVLLEKKIAISANEQLKTNIFELIPNHCCWCDSLLYKEINFFFSNEFQAKPLADDCFYNNKVK